MTSARRHLWKAVGLVLAATAVSPAAAQSVPCGEPACAPAKKFFGGGSAWKQHTRDNLWGYASEFEAPPLGASVYQNFRTMVANGEAARMVLYRYDFIEGTELLNLRGRDQLAKIAAMSPNNSFPIIVERTPENPALAEARRQGILGVLGLNGVAVPPDRVLVSAPIAVGMRGVEAGLLHTRQLDNTRIQATPLQPPVAGTSGLGFSGGGGGAGGGAGGGSAGGTGR